MNANISGFEMTLREPAWRDKLGGDKIERNKLHTHEVSKSLKFQIKLSLPGDEKIFFYS